MARIYFVDDDIASELLVDNLRQRGHDVYRLCSVDEALRDAESLARGDLVVLDLIMPRSATATGGLDGARCTGMSVFRELRKLREDLPLLVFTANQDPAPLDVIRSDPHARYVSRWSAPTFREFVSIMYEMLGILPPSSLLERPFIVHGHDDATPGQFPLLTGSEARLHPALRTVVSPPSFSVNCPNQRPRPGHDQCLRYQ